MCRNIKDAIQLRTTGYGGGDQRRFSAVREEGNRLQQAVQDKRGGLLLRSRRHREDLGAIAHLARNYCIAKGPGGRGGQDESPLSPTIRRMITPIVA